MRSAIKLFLVSICLVIGTIGGSWSYVFIDNFANGNNWITNLKYNLVQGVWSNVNVGANIVTNWYVNNAKLHIGSAGNYIANPTYYNTSFYGAYALFTNTNFNASKQNPFGYEITRAYVFIENGSASYIAGTMDFSIVQAKAGVTNGATTTGIEGTKFDQFVNLAEIEWEDKSTTSYFNWNQASLPGSKLGVSSVTDNSGAVGNLQGILEWNYTVPATNTNYVRFRLVNDGTTVYCYVNPNPFNLNTGPTNTFYLIDTKTVAFSNNLQPMFGLASLTFGGGNPQTAELSNFVIRSVCSNVTTEMSPAELKAGSSVPIYLVMKPVFSTNDEAGVEEFLVDLPEDYTNLTNWAAFTNAMSVSWAGTNGTVFKTFTNQFGDANPTNSGIVKISLKNSRKTLKVRFFSTNVIASSDVFHPLKWGGNANSNAILLVISNFQTTNLADSSGRTFHVTVNNEKYSDTTWTNNATTGPMESYAGDAMDMSKITNTLKNYDSLTFKTYGEPSADGDVSVASIPYYQGTEETTYTYKIDTSRSTNSPNIGAVAIVVPDVGFINITNIESKILGPLSSSNARFTNYLASLGLSNCIYIDYAGANLSIAGLNGSDKITYDVLGTATLPLSAKSSNYQWKSYVNSSAFISGTTWQQTTNTNISRQNVVLIAKSPAAKGSILPFSVAINSSVVSNTISNATYTVVNGGESGNDLLRIAVVVPAEFTNVTAVRSSWLGANTNTTTFTVSWTNLYSPSNLILLVSYTNVSTNFRLLAGSNDVLTFNTIHQITNLDTNAMYREWQAYGDNGNTESFVLGTENAPNQWSITISPPMALGENKIVNPLVYTSDMTNAITNVIYNTSPLGVNVRMAKVVLPVWFTNVLSVTSTHISNTLTNIIVTNSSGTNLVYLYYQGTNGTADAGGLLKSVNEVPTEKDTVVICTLDKIDWNSFTNTNYQLTNLVIPTVVYKTNADTSDTNYYSNCVTGTYSLTNYLTVEYPPISAEYRIDTNIIDTTTVTNTLAFTLTNAGMTGNRIKKVLITLDPAIVSNILSASSTLLGDISSGIASNIITADYASGAQILWGGSKDVITFTLMDKVDGQKYGPVGVYPTVYNDRETRQVTNIMAGGSGTLTFDIPKPHGGAGITPNVYFTGTNMTQAFIAIASNMGTGTDVFQKFQILFPASFTNRVTNVASQWLGMNSSANPAYVVLTPTNVTLIYTNKMMPAGSNDVITLATAYSNLSIGETNNWTFTAFNGYQYLGNDYFELMTNAIIGNTNTYATEMPTANITPVSALTTDLSNTFSLTVRNGTNAGCRSIATVRVDIPYPYQSSGILANYLSGKGFTSLVSNNSLYLNYSTNFTGNNFSTFNIIANKNYITSPTNAVWAVSVYYNGDSDGYRTVDMSGTNNVTVSVVLPDSQSYASVSPKQVGKDLVKSDYSIVITNIGVVGNNALIARILPPYTNTLTDIITNVTGLSNTLGGDLRYTNGYIQVLYYLSNTNLPAKTKDTVYFTAYDNQNLPGFSGQWSVFIGNTTNTNSLIQSQVLLSGDLDMQVIQPGYRTDYRITPNTADTSLYQHTFSAIVNNSGGTGNDVKVIRVYLPPLYSTNGIALNSVLAVSNFLTNYNGTNAIEFCYISNVFITGTNDTITVTASNTLTLGDTNVWVRLMANYYTSETTFSDSDIQVGTNLISFAMPQTLVTAKVLTNEIYTSHKQFTAVYRFINAGQGSNKVRKAWITLPAVFTNAANTVQTSGKVSNASWSGNVLTLNYTNFNSGETDTVTFGLTNTVAYESNVTIDAQFYNGEYTNTATEVSSYDMCVNVVNAPSASITPLSVMSTDYTNDLTLYYNNNSSGTLPTTALRIDLPSVYTNVLSAVSSNGTAFISNLTVYVTNYNGGSGLAKSGVDYIVLKSMDSVTKGYSNNIAWNIYSDNGTGMGKVRETIFGSLKQSLDMPKPNVQGYLETTWFYVATNTDNITNTIRLKIINNGVGANSINTVKIVLPVPPTGPDYLTNVVMSSINSTVLTNEAASVKFINSYTMVLYYTNDYPGTGLPASVTDTVAFDLYYNVQNSGTFPIGIYGENGSLDGYVTASNVSPQTTLLSLVVPEQKSEMYLSDNSLIYTLDTNIAIGCKLNNNSYSFGVQQLFLPFDTNIITNVARVGSTWLGTTNMTPVFTNINSTNGLLVDYGATPLDKRRYDNVTLYVGYHLAVNTNMNVAGIIRFAGSDHFEDTQVPEGNTNILTVQVADFGRIYGYAIPGFLNAGLKVVQTNSDDIITNKFGTNITATADSSGYFLLDFVPDGTYDIVISASKYKDIRLPSFTVVSNTVTNAGTNMLRHALLNARSSQSTELLSQTDSATKIVIYPNTLLRDVSIDIWLTNISDSDMLSGVQNCKTVASPASLGSLFMYWVDMRDSSDSPITELELTNDTLMTLHYDISNVNTQGWDENKLAIYYWRSMTKEWVRIGGTVDKTAQTVTVKVSYLHQYYAVFGEGSVEKTKVPGFVSVKTDPKIFTPRSSNPNYKNLKITIGFDAAVDKYTVKIFDMRGSLVKSYERSGAYAQGEVYWDGKDDQGYEVKGGVYIYRITAGANTYSGTIIIAR